MIQPAERERQRQRDRANKEDEISRLRTPGRERDTQSLMFVCSVSVSVAVPLTCWVRCGGWTDGGRRGDCMNNEGVRVDFLLLPQLIKDPTYWI